MKKILFVALACAFCCGKAMAQTPRFLNMEPKNYITETLYEGAAQTYLNGSLSCTPEVVHQMALIYVQVANDVKLNRTDTLVANSIKEVENVGVSYFAPKADAGESDAQIIMSYCYQRGIGVVKNEKRAIELMKASALQNNPIAQSEYGQFLFSTNNKKEGIEWLTKAADQGLSFAQFTLAHKYFDGDGVTADKGKAIMLLSRAAGQGYTDAVNELMRRMQ